MAAPKDPQKYAEWIRKQSESHKGQKASDAVRARRSEIMKERHQDPDYVEKLMNGIKNREMTPEYRQKLSEASKGRTFSEEARQKSLETRRRNGVSETTRKKRSEAMKGNTYGSNLSQEARARAAERLKANPLRKGKTATPEHRQKLSQIFKGNENIRAAAKAYWDSLSEEERGTRINKTLDALDNKPSSLERLVSEVLASFNISFIPQQRIGPYFADIYIPETNLIIECAGCYWHACEVCGIEDNSKNKRARDKKRTVYLIDHGYRVAILWEHSLRASAIQTVLDAINWTEEGLYRSS